VATGLGALDRNDFAGDTGRRTGLALGLSAGVRALLTLGDVTLGVLDIFKAELLTFAFGLNTGVPFDSTADLVGDTGRGILDGADTVAAWTLAVTLEAGSVLGSEQAIRLEAPFCPW
jgi:hypothetical protein